MADGPSLGTAYLRVAGDFSGIQSQAVGLFRSSQWSALGKAAGVALGAGLAAGGVVVGLEKIGEAFDKASDTIRIKTGATGKELDKLEGSFKKVVSTVPTDFGTASEAVAGLNQRLGLTGKPLTQLSRQLAQLSKITGTDIQENVASVTRLFGDWSVRTSKQTDTLDKLYRLTQTTGIGFSDLSRLMVQFGSPLRQLGFSFDEAAVMFGRFEREGVNMQTLLPGLRMALKNIAVPTDDLAKHFEALGIKTKEPHDALLQIFDVLSADKIKETDQTLLASEVFGGRAWADMKAAVEEGRFEFGKLIRDMDEGKDTISKAERSTRDLNEWFTIIKNNIAVAVEPAASKVFKTISDGAKDVAKIVQDKDLDWSEKFGKLLDMAAGAIADATPKVAAAAAQAGGKIAAAVFQGFMDAPLAGKAAIAGFLLAKFGGAAAFSGIGKLLGRGMGAPFGAAFSAAAIPLIIGLFTRGGVLDTLKGEGNQIGEIMGEKLVEGFEPALSKAIDERSLPHLKHLRVALEAAKTDFVRMGEEVPPVVNKMVGRTDQAIERLQATLGDVREDIGKLQHSWGLSWDEIRQTTDRALDKINESTKAGSEKRLHLTQRALAAEEQAIKHSVDNQTISSQRGQKLLDQIARKKLKAYGITDVDAFIARDDAVRGGPRGGADPSGVNPGLRTGGMVVPGRGSGDTVPLSVPDAMVEPGEGVFVVNRNAMAALERINSLVPRFAAGGWLGSVGGVQVDRRIIPDASALQAKYNLAFTAGYATSGHEALGEHPLGLALDIVPAAGDWNLIDALAHWAEPVQDQPIPPFRWVGYDGDANHGRGNHLHLSWDHTGGLPPPVPSVSTIHGPLGAAIAAGAQIKLPRFTSGFPVGAEAAASSNIVARSMERKLNAKLARMAPVGEVGGVSASANLGPGGWARVGATYEGLDGATGYMGDTIGGLAFAELLQAGVNAGMHPNLSDVLGFAGDMPHLQRLGFRMPGSNRSAVGVKNDIGSGLPGSGQYLVDIQTGLMDAIGWHPNEDVEVKRLRLGGLLRRLQRGGRHRRGDAVVGPGATGHGGAGGPGGGIGAGVGGPGHGHAGPGLGGTGAGTILDEDEDAIARLVSRITEQETLDVSASGPGGGELTAGEAITEYMLNTGLLGRQLHLRKLIKRALPKLKRNSPLFKQFSTRLDELQGPFGSTGEILTTRDKIFALQHPETTAEAPGDDNALALAQAKAGFLEDLADQLQASLNLQTRQMQIFERAPFGGIMHGGGTVPGPPGGQRTMVLESGEDVTPVGGGGPHIEIHMKGSLGVIDAQVEKVLIDKVHRAAQIQIIPGQKVTT